MKRISASTVSRLSLYLRVLAELVEEGATTVSSEEVAGRGGTTAAQVRKDLSLFGTFGTRGLGYSVPELLAALRSILGLERVWRVAVVGAGKIGAAMFGYRYFQRQGFHIMAVFDADPRKVGQCWNGLQVQSERELEAVLQRERIDIVIVAVPAEAAQAVVDRVVAAGVRGILNFAPTKLSVPGGVALNNVDMAVEMEVLSYRLSNGGSWERQAPSLAPGS